MNDLFIKVHNKLPLFRIVDGRSTILYTPGSYVTFQNITANEADHLVQNPEQIKDLETRQSVQSLLMRAQKAVQSWEDQKSMAFKAECLTLHAGSECNLNCEYCYSKNEVTGNTNLTGFPGIESVKSVLKHILSEREKLNSHLTIVYHGAGEPTFHWQQLQDTYGLITEIANANTISLYHYIATNGCLETEKINWLSEHMDLIGISCDGPPHIHKKQRTGTFSNYLSIPEVCKLILQKGGRFDIRTTITPNTISKQVDIVRYLIEDCHANTIRIEPVYLAGAKSFNENQANTFADNFMKAQHYAIEKGCTLSYAGVRVNEIHGAYCDSLRNTLRLTPDGITRNCFLYMRNDENTITGKVNQSNSVFEISTTIQNLKERATVIPDECFNCINMLHCSRGCPDFCLFEKDNSKTWKLDSFRCRLHQILTVEHVKLMAKREL